MRRHAQPSFFLPNGTNLEECRSVRYKIRVKQKNTENEWENRASEKKVWEVFNRDIEWSNNNRMEIKFKLHRATTRDGYRPCDVIQHPLCARQRFPALPSATQLLLRGIRLHFSHNRNQSNSLTQPARHGVNILLFLYLPVYIHTSTLTYMRTYTIHRRFLSSTRFAGRKRDYS